MNILTLDLVKEAVRVSGTAQDAFLTALADAAEDWVERTCGIALVQAAQTEDLDGGGVGLWPRRGPVASVTSVTDNVTGVAEASTAYALRNDRVVRTAGSRWGEGYGRWCVVHSGGYATGAVPAGLIQVCLQLVARAFDATAGEGSAGAGGWSGNFGTLAGSDILTLLAPYRRGPRV